MPLFRSPCAYKLSSLWGESSKEEHRVTSLLPPLPWSASLKESAFLSLYHLSRDSVDGEALRLVHRVQRRGSDTVTSCPLHQFL